MEFSKSKLYGISNKKYLSELLEIEPYKLKMVESYFTITPFNKETNGKIRTLFNPYFKHKRALKKMNSLLMQIPIPSYVFGGIKKRDYAMNASVHKSNQYFLLIDIQNFFPTTDADYVYHFFRGKLCMSEDIAKICTLLTTVPNPQDSNKRMIAQGFPTSPILSFLSYSEMYKRINNLTASKNITFSCFYDDFTFSSHKLINKSLKRQVSNIIKEYSLMINKSKTRLLKNRRGVKITGAIVNNDKIVSPNKFQKEMFDSFLELKRLYLNKDTNKEELLNLCNKVQGYLSAIKTVERGRKFVSISQEVKKIRNTVNSDVKG